MRRRRAAALLIGGALGGAAFSMADAPPEIRIVAKRFALHPEEVTTKLGRPLTLVLTTEDRIHGFKMPDFGIRADIVPGQETRVVLTPGKAGRFVFLCDVFCGDGHDETEGTLVVDT
jgi:cytochrome c oxidase subunit 2